MRNHKHFIFLIVALVSLMSSAAPISAAEKSPQGPQAQAKELELGIYGGVFFPSENHEWYDESLLRQKPLKDVVLDFGLRLSFLPFSFFGLELEGGILPGQTESEQSVWLYAFRGHLLLQFPARFCPFIVAGGGGMGISSASSVLGDDLDGIVYYGVGAKFFLTDWLLLRLDGRHLIGPQAHTDDFTNHFEALLGISWVWRREKEEPVKAPPVDTDKDGIFDEQDKCPITFGQTPTGCPPPDTDHDGVIDEKDKCPRQYGPALDGCPLPKDSDNDGTFDDKDKCPGEVGIAPDGCPLRDSDNDGILDDKDKCPGQSGVAPDGCPLPEAMKKFTGNIAGINFQVGSAIIKKDSYALLDKAAAVLAQYSTINLIIRGHTDNQGKRDKNLELSRKRAEAVKEYLLKEGIAENRLRTEGLGPDEPVADNKTREGRAQNRRIEFKLDTP